MTTRTEKIPFETIRRKNEELPAGTPDTVKVQGEEGIKTFTTTNGKEDAGVVTKEPVTQIVEYNDNKPAEPSKPSETEPSDQRVHQSLNVNLTKPEAHFYDLKADNDGDGYDNYTELVLGSDPENKESVPQPKVGTEVSTDKPTDKPADKPMDKTMDKLVEPSKSSMPSAPVATASVASLPETGEADAYLIFGAAAMSVLAGIGLVAMRKEEM